LPVMPWVMKRVRGETRIGILVPGD
jgi:hypothetical protein